MTGAEELLNKYVHLPEDFPVLAEQTHKVLRDGRIVNEKININENIMLRTQAFSSSVFSAPLLDDKGKVLDLAAEKKTRRLCRDLWRLHDEFRDGQLFFTPPEEWVDFDDFDSILEDQGVVLLPWESSEAEQERVRRSPLFYLNFITKLRNYGSK